jgi:hypothetical protein
MKIRPQQVSAVDASGSNLFEGDQMLVGSTAGKWVPLSSVNTHVLVPKGTTAQRPGYNPEGGIRYNTSLQTVEFSTSSAWVQLPSGTAFTTQVYSSSNPYTAGNMIIHAGQIVVANSNISAGVTPVWGASLTSTWRPLMGPSNIWKGVYAVATAYSANDVVVSSSAMSGSKLYVSRVASTGQALTNTNYWLPYVPGTVDLSSLIPVPMIGATSLANGTSGTVPAPSAGQESNFLSGNGTWTSFSTLNLNGFPGTYTTFKSYPTGSLARDGAAILESTRNIASPPAVGDEWLNTSAWQPILASTSSTNLAAMTITYRGEFINGTTYNRGDQVLYRGNFWTMVSENGPVNTEYPGINPYIWAMEVFGSKNTADFSYIGTNWRTPLYVFWNGSALVDNQVKRHLINGDWFVIDIDPAYSSLVGCLKMDSSCVRFRVSIYGCDSAIAGKTLIVKRVDNTDLLTLDLDGDYYFEYVGSKWRVTYNNSASVI